VETESRRWADELLERIEGGDSRKLEGWLVECAGADDERREAVADAIGVATRRLAPHGDPPAGSAAETWRALVGAADRLYGSGVYALGRLDFLSDDLFALLVAEAREQRPAAVEATPTRRAVGEAGHALAGLAVSRQLREALGEALGHPVAPTYDAIYLYEPPASHVRTHVDARGHEVVLHLVLEHTLPGDGSEGSALVVHLPGEPEAKRLRFRPSEAVALRGRGTVHSWEPLRDGEWRTLTAVGFERAVS
jgi:hypothetical protein